MRNGKKILLTVLAGACAIALFPACKGCGKKNEKPKTEILPPEITATDEGLFWTGAEGATEYKYRFNGGEYQTAKAEERRVSFPEEQGEYTFEILSVKGKTKSVSVCFSFTVAEQAVMCETDDNRLNFTGENVWYSVNGGEETPLGDRTDLDFSAAEIGESFTVEYYAKGGFWSQEETAYYVDGEKRTVSLTVSETLSVPKLTEYGNSLVWESVPHASSYQVKIDGEEIPFSGERKIDFPETVGEHILSVRAIGDGAYKNSAERVYVMTTEESCVPSVNYSVEEDLLVLSEKDLAYARYAIGDGEFQPIESNTLAYAAGLKLRLDARYDETERVYRLQSKTLSVVKRAAPQISFSMTGQLSWNPSDEGNELQYFYSFSSSGAEFSETRSNRLDVSLFPAGEYTFHVYGAQYLFEDETKATFYLPGETAQASVRILEEPELDYTTNVLLWTAVDYACGYEYKVDGGEWTDAGMAKSANVTEFARYSVRATGDETDGNYIVNSASVSILFDPALTVQNTTKRIEELATFDSVAYQNYVSAPTAVQSTGKGLVSILTDTSNESEKAVLENATGGVLKVTATDKKPKNENLWGNSDGVRFDLFKPYAMNEQASVTFRFYLKTNAERANGWLYPNKDVKVNLEGRMAFVLCGVSAEDGTAIQKLVYLNDVVTDGWTEYTMFLSKYKNDFSFVTGVEIFFQNIGKEGDVFYVDQVTFDMPMVCDSDKIDFDENPEYANAVSYTNGTELVKDTVNGNDKTVLYAKNVYQKYDVSLLYGNIILNAGDTVTITIKAVSEVPVGADGNGGGIQINKSWKVNFTSSPEGKWKTYTVTIKETTVLTSIDFHVYNPNYVYQLYIASVDINRNH